VRLPPAWREKVMPWPVRARFDDEAAVEDLLAKLGL
jgi:tetraacyldisaccharide 4'-kinase